MTNRRQKARQDGCKLTVIWLHWYLPFRTLVSMSTISKEKFEQLSSSLSAAFMGTGRGGVYGYNDGTVLYSVKENTTGDILEDGEEL